jgi:tetratricopeptide (TPR) repeat protein
MNAEKLNESGNLLYDAGDFAGAADCYRQSIAADPRFADAHNNLGQALRRQRRLDEAKTALEQAVAVAPRLAIAHANLGGVLKELGDATGAVASLRLALEIFPGLENARLELAHLEFLAGDCESARRTLLQGFALVPASANLHFFLGNLDREEMRPEEGLRNYERALALDPTHAEAELGLARVLMDLGEWERARAVFESACARPDPLEARIAQSFLLLATGDFADGFAAMEQRLESAAPILQFVRDQVAKMSGKPLWHGEALDDRNLLVWTEQGIGDNVMMCRYVPLLRARGAGRVLVYCEPQMAGLLQSLPGVDAVVLKPAIPDAQTFDCHCSIMSLPHLFATREDTIPGAVPYLRVAQRKKEFWSDRVAKFDGFRVGLAWAGTRHHKMDYMRSIPFGLLEPILQIPGVRFFSLQQGDAAAEAGGAKLTDWMADCTELTDTAALIDNLDLVISVDTAVAHLAGALGKRVWMLNRFATDWRWMLGRTDSPWYPSMRIYRQPARNDWQSPILAVAADLAALAARS